MTLCFDINNLLRCRSGGAQKFTDLRSKKAVTIEESSDSLGSIDASAKGPASDRTA